MFNVMFNVQCSMFNVQCSRLKAQGSRLKLTRGAPPGGDPGLLLCNAFGVEEHGERPLPRSGCIVQPGYRGLKMAEAGINVYREAVA
jgi:hypothetical protein